MSPYRVAVLEVQLVIYVVHSVDSFVRWSVERLNCLEPPGGLSGIVHSSNKAFQTKHCAVNTPYDDMSTLW